MANVSLMGTGILAVDPGKKTGMAVLYDGTEFLSAEIDGAMEFLDFAVNLLDANSDRKWQVVCESYIVTPETIKKSRQNYSLEIIGALRWVCHDRELPFSLQTPANGKAFSTDDKLKRMGWYTPNFGHANDAARHLLLYTISHGVVNPAQLLDDAI